MSFYIPRLRIFFSLLLKIVSNLIARPNFYLDFTWFSTVSVSNSNKFQATDTAVAMMMIMFIRIDTEREYICFGAKMMKYAWRLASNYKTHFNELHPVYSLNVWKKKKIKNYCITKSMLGIVFWRKIYYTQYAHMLWMNEYLCLDNLDCSNIKIRVQTVWYKNIMSLTMFQLKYLVKGQSNVERYLGVLCASGFFFFLSSHFRFKKHFLFLIFQFSGQIFFWREKTGDIIRWWCRTCF